jgi:hypothetical protein
MALAILKLLCLTQRLSTGVGSVLFVGCTVYGELR